MSDVPVIVQSWKALGLVFTLHSEGGRMHARLRSDAPGRSLIATQQFLLDGSTTRVRCWSAKEGTSSCDWWMREVVGRKGSGEHRGSLDAQEWLTGQVHRLYRPKEMSFEEQLAIVMPLQRMSEALRTRCPQRAVAFADRFHEAARFHAFCLWRSAPDGWWTSALESLPALGVFLVALRRYQLGPRGLEAQLMRELAAGATPDRALRDGYERFVAWAAGTGRRRVRAGRELEEDSPLRWALIEQAWPGAARAFTPLALKRASRIGSYGDPWDSLLPPLSKARPKRKKRTSGGRTPGVDLGRLAGQLFQMAQAHRKGSDLWPWPLGFDP